ncbi:uncharacterized protein LOC118467556 [Anopheles albimanus]|uniref:uncharacterized protein LOC118467556 n=1 Tax=Anopheles albimanus TaxID=7167 RepID=UPI00163E9057|nr:uncharacterized protein LOC118467556 [Anopheles albimanus]
MSLFRFQLVPMVTKVETGSNFIYANITATIRHDGPKWNQSIDVDVDIRREMKDMKLTLEYYTVFGNKLTVSYYAGLRGEVMPNALFTRSVDFCDFLERPTMDRLIKGIYDVVLPSSNLPKRCPVLAGEYYMIALITHANSSAPYQDVTVTCPIHNTTPITNQSIDCDIHLRREIRDMKFTMSYHLVSNGVEHSALVSRSVEYCAFLRRPTMDRLLKLVYDAITRTTSLPKRCPLKPGYYYIRNIQPARIPIPSFVPESKFVLKEQFFLGSERKLFFTIRFYGKLMRYNDESGV